MGERIALYGGSFNPIHHGHLIIARAIAERLRLDRVLFLPSASPPHKSGQAMAAPDHRAAMVRIAIIDEPLFAFSDFDLARDGPSYTVDTIEHFRGEYGEGARLFWIIGADSLAELTAWYKVEDLVASCRVITALRPGWETIDWDQLRERLGAEPTSRLQADVIDVPRIEISASDIRTRLSRGQSVRYLVPDQVLAYLEQHALYRD